MEENAKNDQIGPNKQRKRANRPEKKADAKREAYWAR